MSDRFEANADTAAIRGLVFGCLLSIPFWAIVVEVVRALRT